MASFAQGKNVKRVSVVAVSVLLFMSIGEVLTSLKYSMGAVVARVALNQPCMRQFDDKFHVFVSIAGPHLGMLGSDSNIVGFGQWAFMKWKKIRSLEQLGLEDSFMLKLSEESEPLSHFTHLALVSSAEDMYVPAFSARIELPIGNKSATIAEMQQNLVKNVLTKVPKLSKIEMSFEFASKRTVRARVDAVLGRAAHIHILDSIPLCLSLILIYAGEWFA